jgi:hypothetical protein
MKQRQKRLGDYYILLISVGHLFCVITAETLLTLSQKEKESLPPCDDPPKHVRESFFVFVCYVCDNKTKQAFRLNNLYNE